jgi:hypothetical protein
VNRSDGGGHPDYPGHHQPVRQSGTVYIPQTTTGIGSTAGAAICR